MANPEHVAVVRQGAAAIAQWRQAHPKERLDLSGANLSRAALIGAARGALSGFDGPVAEIPVNQFEQIYKEVVDYLSPLQTVYEQAIYHLLLRKSYLEGACEVRIGQRALAKLAPLPTKSGTFNKGGQIRKSSQAQIKSVIEFLASKGHIEIGDTTFKGTLYKIKLPREIPACEAQIKEAQRHQHTTATQDDFYNIPDNRVKVFERDNYQCRYCDAKVTPQNATLDHLRPVSGGGDHSLQNLVTACLRCNAIKAARTPDGDLLIALLDRYKAVARERIAGESTFVSEESFRNLPPP